MPISLLSNLKINMKAQTNERDAFSTIADMVAFREEYLPDMYDSFCYETGLKYRFNRSNSTDEILGKWRVIGEGGSSDLSSYYTKTETNNLLDNKVDKVSGKDLSTNDFTDAYKQQIDDNKTAIETLNGNSTVVGSVDSKVSTAYSNATSYTDTECAKKVDKVSGKGLSTNDFTDELKTKLNNLENYDDTALGNRVTANENAITVLNGDTTVNGSVDKKVATCLTDSKSYTDTSIQNAIKQTAIVCDSKPTLNGDTITYYQGGVKKTITSDNKTKFYYTSGDENYSTIFIENTEFTDTVASVNFSDYVSKTNDVVSTYTSSDADKTKIPNIGAMDALKSLVDTELNEKVNVSDVESSISSSSDNPVKSSALYTEFAKKVDVEQGSANEGKILQVNSNGNLGLVDPQSTIDLSDYVSKTNDVANTYSGQEVDKTKIPNLGAMDALKTLVDTELNEKVSTAQGVANEGKILQVNGEGNLALVDPSSMGNNASDVSYENASYPSLTNVQLALDNLNLLYNTKLSIVASLPITPHNQETVLYVGTSDDGLKSGGIYQYQVSEWVLINDCNYKKEKIFEPSEIVIHSINHRGANTYAPENTMSAFRISKELGFDMVECDVDFTSDNVPVIIHDSTVDRTSNGTGEVHSFTFEDIRKLDFGSWKSTAYSGEKIPSFDEFILGCRTLGLHPYIEIKERDYINLELVTTLVNIVHKYDMQDKVTWISFGIDKLQSVVKVDKYARVGFIEEFMSTNILDESINRIKTLDTGYNEIFYDLNLGLVNTSIINRLKEEKIKLEVWIVDSVNLITSADDYITGFTSDNLRADWVLRDALYADGDDLDFVNLTPLVQKTEYVDTLLYVYAKRRNGYVYMRCFATLGDVPEGKKYHASDILVTGIPKKYIPYQDVAIASEGWGLDSEGFEVSKLCRISVTNENFIDYPGSIRISESNMVKGDNLRAEWIYPVTYHIK